MHSIAILNCPSTPPLQITASLPALSWPLEAIHKRNLFAFHRLPPPARLETLSFDPPLLEMKSGAGSSKGWNGRGHAHAKNISSGGDLRKKLLKSEQAKLTTWKTGA
jgi:hypothetical protein